MKIEELNNLILIWGPLSKEGLFYLNDTIKDKPLRVLVAENRPHLIGLKHNIPLLKKEGIPLVYCTDNMLGFLFYRGKIKEVLLFCKEFREKEIIASSGSLFAIYLAKLHRVPVS